MSATRQHRQDYRPVGTALAAFYAKEPEVLLSGPAGTGKSRAILEKIFLLAEVVYPGLRALFVRKTRASLTETGLFTWEQFVLPPGHAAHPNNGGAHRSHRQQYRFPNGSEVVVGGMDKPAKIMSSEYDIIYPQEAIELTEEDWEALTTRLRNGRMPYQQIVGDTNPSFPHHWLKKRCEKPADPGNPGGPKVCRMIDTRHEDNPVLHDGAGWTPFGVSYLSKLDALTGPRKHRLRHGRWVQAEGVVYEGWDAAVHLVDPFPVPREWARYWSIDFGYTNPFVCQWWAEDPDGRLYLYRERYLSKCIVEDHARVMLKAVGAWDEKAGRPDWAHATEPKPRAVVCDHDAEDRATLTRHLGGTATVAAKKAITVGIQMVGKRLTPAGDGKPRLFVFRDAPTVRDGNLEAAKKPVSTAEEIDGYVWDVRDGRPPKEEPVDADNHGMDALRYMVMHRDAPGAQARVW